MKEILKLKEFWILFGIFALVAVFLIVGINYVPASNKNDVPPVLI